jgi:hypothetical protein
MQILLIFFKKFILPKKINDNDFVIFILGLSDGNEKKVGVYDDDRK